MIKQAVEKRFNTKAFQIYEFNINSEIIIQISIFYYFYEHKVWLKLEAMHSQSHLLQFFHNLDFPKKKNTHRNNQRHFCFDWNIIILVKLFCLTILFLKYLENLHFFSVGIWFHRFGKKTPELFFTNSVQQLFVLFLVLLKHS